MDIISIPLTGGKVSIVDSWAYSLVQPYKWRVDAWGYARSSRPSAASKSGYCTILMHRLVVNAKSGEQIDHINGDPLDNRQCNLRKCTNAQNQMNRKKATGLSSRFKGVTWNHSSQKWQAQIKFDQRVHYLGVFEREEDAALAYNVKAEELFGAFAKINPVLNVASLEASTAWK